MFRTPHASIRDENPVFDFELRRVKRLASPGRLWLYSALLQAVPLILVTIGYFLILRDYVISYSTSVPSNYYGYFNEFYSVWSAINAVTLVASVLMAFFGGIYYMSVSIHSINTQINNGHWDMLRLSPLADASVLRAKEAIAHIRAWRLMHIEVALRISQITGTMLLLFFPPYEIAQGHWLGDRSVFGGFIRDIARQPVVTLAQMTLLLTIAYVWIMEPRWRMRTITTIGLALSARVHNLSMASVAAFFALIGFHIAQAALLFGTIWGLLIVSQYYKGVYVPIQVIAYTTFFGMVYFTYWATRRLAWRSALRQAFKADQ